MSVEPGMMGIKMNAVRLRYILAWTCLIAFGLNCTVFTGGLVVCSDHRGAHLEFGCERDGNGMCVSSCSDSSDDDHPDQPNRPCDDTLLQGDQYVPRVAASQIVLPISAFLYDVQSLHASELFAPTFIRVRRSTARDRPPDSVNRLRTVVLLV